MASVRKQNLKVLESMGFKPAKWLPEKRSESDPALRPIHEVAGRLAALKGVFMWAAAPPEHVPDVAVLGYFQRNTLTPLLAKDEQKVIATARAEAHERYCDLIGWRLENMWPLAWMLGLEQEPDLQGMIGEETIGAVIEFISFQVPLAEWVSQHRLRTVEEVDRLEDLFYCAHNAVRSAQMGGKTVPRGFNPVSDGGVIHERRHALTWALSPGTAWDDTDLST